MWLMGRSVMILAIWRLGPFRRLPSPISAGGNLVYQGHPAAFPQPAVPDRPAPRRLRQRLTNRGAATSGTARTKAAPTARTRREAPQCGRLPAMTKRRPPKPEEARAAVVVTAAPGGTVAAAGRERPPWPAWTEGARSTRPPCRCGPGAPRPPTTGNATPRPLPGLDRSHHQDHFGAKDYVLTRAPARP